MRILNLIVLLAFIETAIAETAVDRLFNSAAYYGDSYKIEQLFREGNQIDDPTITLVTALGRGFPDIFWLVSEKTDFSKVNLNEVLFQACFIPTKGYASVVKYLLEHGADPLAAHHGEFRSYSPVYNLAFETPSPYATETKEVLKILLDHAEAKTGKTKQEILDEIERKYGA